MYAVSLSVCLDDPPSAGGGFFILYTRRNRAYASSPSSAHVFERIDLIGSYQTDGGQVIG